MAFNRLERNEILEKFIISANYGTPNVFPYGAGSAVVLSKVSCRYDDGDSWSMPMVCIHRNQGPYLMHVETMFVRLIRRTSRRAREIKIEMIQNYSPCNDQANGEYCAQAIVDYKMEMESQGKQIDISITFANFYRTVVYPGNDANRAEQNRNGLRLLRDNGVQLRLLCFPEWFHFLFDDQFVSLNDNDREECLNRAFSNERRARERFDRHHYRDILGMGFFH